MISYRFVCLFMIAVLINDTLGIGWNKTNKIPVKLRRNATCIEGRILYPFGPECGDRELSKDMTRSHPIDLGYELRFMGHTFNKAYVNQHGFISFQDSFLGEI